MRAEYQFAPGLGLAIEGDAATVSHFDREYGSAATLEPTPVAVEVVFPRHGSGQSGGSVPGGHKSVRWRAELTAPDATVLGVRIETLRLAASVRPHAGSGLFRRTPALGSGRPGRCASAAGGGLSRRIGHDRHHGAVWQRQDIALDACARAGHRSPWGRPGADRSARAPAGRSRGGFASTPISASACRWLSIECLGASSPNSESASSCGSFRAARSRRLLRCRSRSSGRGARSIRRQSDESSSSSAPLPRVDYGQRPRPSPMR